MYDLSEYLIVISLILECRSVYNHLVGKAWISYAIVIMLAAGVLGALISQKIIYFNKSRAIAFVTIAIYLLLYIFFNSYHWSSYLRCLLCLVIIFIYYLFCYRDGIPSILYKYENVILLISVISLFFWVFGILLGIIKPSGIIHTTWSGSSESAVFPSYFNIYFKSQRDAEPFLRNSAIFTESPMFSFHVSLALLFEVLLSEKFSLRKEIILIVTILSTHSTTGLSIVLALVVYQIMRNKKKNVWMVLIYLAFLISLPFIASIPFYLFNAKMTTMSGSLRVDDFRVGFLAWSKHKVFGGGFENEQYLQSFMANWRIINIGFSNSIMYILALTGIYVSIVYFGAVIKGVVTSIINKDFQMLLFSALFFYQFAITVTPNNYLIFFVLTFIAINKKANLPSNEYRYYYSDVGEAI